MSTIPVLKFGGVTLQGKSRFGPHEAHLLETCHKLTHVNDIYRLLALRRNAARAWRLREVAEGFILPQVRKGIIPVVVVSAFDWATDKLEQMTAWMRVVCSDDGKSRATALARGEADMEPVVEEEMVKLREKTNFGVQREFARLLMSGELRANAALAIVLESLGCSARSFTGREAGIMTTAQPVDALIEQVAVDHFKGLIDAGIVPVVAGFQGYYHSEQTGRDEVSILGRGGSNLTAVALADALNQEDCVMLTNVDGLYTRDPNECEDAWKYEEITADELLAWKEFPQVIQKEAVEFAVERGINIWLRSGFDASATGTLIRCK